MGQNAADIRIAITGKLLTAALGSAGPTDVSTPWATPAWTDHGFLDPNGVVTTPKVTSYDVKGWQSDTSLRSRIVERIREIKFILLQTGGLNTRLYEGGGTWAQVPAYSSVGATTFTATTATDPSAAWAVNAYAGRTIRAGASTGVIVSNTATAATITAWTGGTPTAATVFTIDGLVAQFTPPLPGVDDHRMLGVEFTDGTITKRWIYPDTIVVAPGPNDTKATGESKYDITMRVLGDNWSMLSNDPADQAATLAA